VFSKDTRATEYGGDSGECTISLVKTIIKLRNKIDITKGEIISELINEYEKYSERFFSNIISIFKNQGKLKIAKEIDSLTDFKRVLSSKDYYLTNIDFWILSKKYNLPIILVSQKPFLEHTVSGVLKDGRNLLLLNKSDVNQYFFIKPSATRSGEAPTYRLFYNETGPYILISSLDKTWGKYITENMEKFTLEMLLTNGSSLKNRFLKLK